jgi:hypothetical protein
VLVAVAGLAAFGGVVSAAGGGAPLGRHLLATRGIWTEFENPAAATGWFSGELLQAGTFDRAQVQVDAQLDAMRAMGVNEIAYELRSADPVWVPGDRTPPVCNVSPDTGLQYPQPGAAELANLGRLFDLVASKGMKIALLLDNTHMDDRANSQRWLGAILGAVQGKPALDYVTFGGDAHLIDLNGDGVDESCGGQSEAPLWLGPSSLQGSYVQWAIAYGISLGISAHQLTAESIVGFYPHVAQAATGPDADGNHFWPPIVSMKVIFDRLGIPDAERTYSISFYEHRKCAGSFPGLACSDEDAQTWAAETAQAVRDTVGASARVTATEFSDQAPVDPSWPTEKAVENLGVLFRQYGIDGGTFWHWQHVTGDAPADWADPVKMRGQSFYYPVQRELADLYGFHLNAVPNGSFETGTRGWTVAGRGTAKPTPLDETDVPWRGTTFLGLTATGLISVSSAPIKVSAQTAYVTTIDARFSWTGEPRVTSKTSPAKRPQFDAQLRFLTCRQRPSRIRPTETFRYFQQSSTHAFETLPLHYVTPRDACYEQIQLIAARNNLPAPISVDIDNIR